MADPSRLPSGDILVLAPNWLGDVVMTTPLLSWLADPLLRGGTPPLRVHLAVRDSWAPLFTDDPRLSGVVPIERTGRHAGLGGILRQASLLRRGRFSAILLGPPSMRAGLVSFLAGIPRRVGYRSDGRDLLLTRGLATRVRGTVHYAEEMLELGGALLGSDVTGDDLPAPALPGCDVIPAAEVPAGGPLIALAPGTTYGEAKTWPLERAAEFLTDALKNQGYRVVLLGDAHATPLATALSDRVGIATEPSLEAGGRLTDLTGRTDLTRVASVLKSCRGFVGNDSGLMHLAAALGVPTVGIFGSSNPDWTAPRGMRTAAVVADGYDCRPCYRKTCNQPRFCLDDIEGTRVMKTLTGLMGSAAEGAAP